LVKDILELTPEGYIRTDCIMQTSLKGVYAAGDVRDTPLRQVVTAVADGAVAATKAVEYLAT
jgi:thioredoxin reductase (NADPH)